MKRMILSLVAALTFGGGIAATAADAQPASRTIVRTTDARPGNRTVVRTTVVRRNWHRTWRHGWNNHRRVCRTVWRRHQRIRTCRSW